jgi:hypothetical protein
MAFKDKKEVIIEPRNQNYIHITNTSKKFIYFFMHNNDFQQKLIAFKINLY